MFKRRRNATSRKSVKKSSALSRLKRKFAGKEGTAFEILDEVKKVKPQQWRNRSEVEQLARKYIDKLGLRVSEERIKQFVDAYQDAVRNGSNTDELIQKYGKNVDEETLKTLKKYTPK
jgi:adenine-specific DNA methylase